MGLGMRLIEPSKSGYTSIYAISYHFTCITLMPIDSVFNLLEAHGILNDVIVSFGLPLIHKVDELCCIWISFQLLYYYMIKMDSVDWGYLMESTLKLLKITPIYFEAYCVLVVVVFLALCLGECL